ncbi:C4-dicarboxylate transporter DctM subunit [Bradyrhizobium sp. i1.4.4]
MFLLMGSFVSNSGMSRELFRAANGFVGHLRGGLGIATVGACGGFAAICGSSVATAATFSAVAYPEMRRFGYPQSFATGVIAAGGTLGAMLPPSTVLAVYGIITEQDIGKLFIAGIIPGLLAMTMYMITIFLIGHFRPDFLPKGKVLPWRERFAGLKDIWAPVLLFVFVIGGLYGLPFLPRFTPTEAGGVGAAGAFIIGVVTGRLDREKILASLLQATRTAAAVFTVLIGALIFGYFLTVTQTPQKVTEFLTGLGLGPYGVLALIMVMYLVLGCLMDAMAMIILTVPIIFPVITHLGFDPIWFGVIIVMTVELGLIHPPVGMNVFGHQERGEGRLLLHHLQGRDPVRGDGSGAAGDFDRVPAAGDLAADTDDGALVNAYGATRCCPLSPCGRGWLAAIAARRVRGISPPAHLRLRRQPLIRRFAPPSPTRGEGRALRLAQ